MEFEPFMNKINQVTIPGILGGMEPEATVDFMSKIITQTNTRSENSIDQDHIHLMIDHNPKVPNCQAAINGEGENVGAYLALMAKNLEKSGADFIAMVCNTAHAFENDIRGAIKIPFVSIIDEVVAKLTDSWGDRKKVGLMAAEGCLNAQLYQGALTIAGFETVLWSDLQLKSFMSLLYRIKAGERNKDVHQKMKLLANNLVENGAQILLAGCTEIPLILDGSNLPVPLLASTDILVESVIDYALGNKSIAVTR